MKDISAIQLDYKNYTLLKLEHEHIIARQREQQEILDTLDEEVHEHEKVLLRRYHSFEKDLDEMANELFEALNTNNDGKVDLVEILSSLFTDINKDIIHSVSKTMLENLETSIDFDRVKQCIADLIVNQ